MRCKSHIVNLLFPFLSLHMQEVGRRMGLETNKLSSLWKDRAVVEINVAVLYSFQVSQRVVPGETLNTVFTSNSFKQI